MMTKFVKKKYTQRKLLKARENPKLLNNIHRFYIRGTDNTWSRKMQDEEMWSM